MAKPYDNMYHIACLNRAVIVSEMLCEKWHIYF